MNSVCPVYQRREYRNYQQINDIYASLDKNNLKKKKSETFRGQRKLLNYFILSHFSKFSTLLCIFICLCFVCIFLIRECWLSNSENPLISRINVLKNEFPSQTNKSWQSIFSALEKSDNSIKSLLLLYEGDKKTCDCLTNKLASFHLKKPSVDKEYFTFNITTETSTDYGVILQHYRAFLKRHGVLIVDLNKISSSIARMFHFLCDETHQGENPPLIIFTLSDLKNGENLKPLHRAGSILRKKWKELLENEIHSLISRITKNVVLVITEKSNSVCVGF